nr:hypothetical protein [Tanacetum cinerariifolium]
AVAVTAIGRRKRPCGQRRKVLAAFHFVDLPGTEQSLLDGDRTAAGWRGNAPVSQLGLSLWLIHVFHSVDLRTLLSEERPSS